MGKLKKEMKKIHSRKVKRAKEKIKAFRKGEISYDQLNALARKFLARQNKKKKETT